MTQDHECEARKLRQRRVVWKSSNGPKKSDEQKRKKCMQFSRVWMSEMDGKSGVFCGWAKTLTGLWNGDGEEKARLRRGECERKINATGNAGAGTRACWRLSAASAVSSL